MATKSAKKTQTNRAKEVKNTVKDLNKRAVKFSDKLVDETLATGEEWQAIFAKAVKNGTVLLDKQTDMVFDTLEEVKAQILKGNFRFRKLFNIDYAERQIAKFQKDATKKVMKTAVDAKERVEKLADRFEDVAEDALETLNEKVDEVINVKKPVAKTSVKKATAKKVTKKAAPKAKVAAKKVVKSTAKKAVKATTKKTVKAAAKSDLKVIEGIGPKLESILNEAGIVTFDQLAKAKAADVKAILLAAGPRYKMHNPTTWAEQAKLAAAGKMDALKKLQGELKGGVKA